MGANAGDRGGWVAPLKRTAGDDCPRLPIDHGQDAAQLHGPRITLPISSDYLPRVLELPQRRGLFRGLGADALRKHEVKFIDFTLGDIHENHLPDAGAGAIGSSRDWSKEKFGHGGLEARLLGGYHTLVPHGNVRGTTNQPSQHARED